MKLSLIVAMTDDRVIGRDGKMPWRLPEDLARFKGMTMGKPVIMGRKTFESIGRVLPGRTNIILTRDENFSASKAIVVHRLEEAFSEARKENPQEVFVIGGAEIYKQALPHVVRFYLTLIHHPFEGDTYFPDLNLEKGFQVLEKLTHQATEDRNFAYTFLTAERI